MRQASLAAARAFLAEHKEHLNDDHAWHTNRTDNAGLIDQALNPQGAAIAIVPDRDDQSKYRVLVDGFAGTAEVSVPLAIERAVTLRRNSVLNHVIHVLEALRDSSPETNDATVPGTKLAREAVDHTAGDRW